MFLPKFCEERDKVEGMIPIKEEPLVDDPNDDTHPNSRENAVNPNDVEGKAKILVENNWAWKYKAYNPMEKKMVFY